MLFFYSVTREKNFLLSTWVKFIPLDDEILYTSIQRRANLSSILSAIAIIDPPRRNESPAAMLNVEGPLAYLQNIHPPRLSVFNPFTSVALDPTRRSASGEPAHVAMYTYIQSDKRTRVNGDRVNRENALEIGENLLKQIHCGEHNGGRGGHGDASRVDARSCEQLGVHAGRIDDQLLRNIHPSPGVDGERRVGEINHERHDGSAVSSHHSENLLGDQNGLEGAPLDHGLPLQPRQRLEHFVMRHGRGLLRRQIQGLIIVVDRQPGLGARGEAGARTVVPLERRSLWIP